MAHHIVAIGIGSGIAIVAVILFLMLIVSGGILAGRDARSSTTGYRHKEKPVPASVQR